MTYIKNIMILFTKSTYVLQKYLHDEQKLFFACYNFFPDMAQNSASFYMFREISE